MNTTNRAFGALLKERKMTVQKLADMTGAGRSHLSQVLNGRRGGGQRTKERLFMVLTQPEVEALGWIKEYAIWWADKKISIIPLTTNGGSVPLSTSQAVQS